MSAHHHLDNMKRSSIVNDGQYAVNLALHVMDEEDVNQDLSVKLVGRRRRHGMLSLGICVRLARVTSEVFDSFDEMRRCT